MSRCDDLRGQSQSFKQLDLVVADIDFPPSMLDAGGRGVFMVIVVPAFADSNQRDQPVVATVFAGFVVAIAEHMAQ